MKKHDKRDFLKNKTIFRLSICIVTFEKIYTRRHKQQQQVNKQEQQQHAEIKGEKFLLELSLFI